MRRKYQSINPRQIDSPIVTPDEAAERLGTSPAEVERLVRTGELRGAVLGRHVRMLEADVTARAEPDTLNSSAEERLSSAFEGLLCWVGTRAASTLLRLRRDYTRILFHAAIIPSAKIAGRWVSHGNVLAGMFEPGLVSDEVLDMLGHTNDGDHNRIGS